MWGKWTKNLNWRFIVIVTAALLGSVFLSGVRDTTSYTEAGLLPWISRRTSLGAPDFSDRLKQKLLKNEFPDDIELYFDGTKTTVKLKYTLDARLQTKAARIFNSYRPDHGALVAMDATSGEIISILSYRRSTEKSRDTNSNIVVESHFPAASIFKVVTAAAAIDQGRLSPNSTIFFHGSNHTLYRRNVEGPETAWSRTMTVQEAFGKSVNTVFGKIGLFHLGADTLRNYAEKFMFNRSFLTDLPVQMGTAPLSNVDRWGLVEAASGFNTRTTMSPIHGAMIAATIANQGLMMSPYIVRSAIHKDGRVLFENRPNLLSRVMSPQAATEMKLLMEETIHNGTSKKVFRKVLRNKSMADVSFGGKTGSLTGTNPPGKHDWFIGYADFNGRKMAISVLTIHEELWRVKSSQVAAEYFEEVARLQQSQERKSDGS